MYPHLTCHLTSVSTCTLDLVKPYSPTTLAGLYIYGSVGSGKSLLMDMFFAEVEAADAVPLRRRLHFNAAMLEARVVCREHVPHKLSGPAVRVGATARFQGLECTRFVALPVIALLNANHAGDERSRLAPDHQTRRPEQNRALQLKQQSHRRRVEVSHSSWPRDHKSFRMLA